MSHIYSAVVKGTVADAEYAAKAYGGQVVGVHAEMSDRVTVFVEFPKPKAIYVWFDSSSANAPSTYTWGPFPAGALLYFRLLDDEEIAEVAKHYRRSGAPRGGIKFDLDGFSAFESARKSVGAFSVSTLVPGIGGMPRYRYFETHVEALTYARQRARSGPRLRQGGKAYYVLGYSVDAPTGAVAYRVFRAFRGQEQRHGYSYPERKREFIVVQQAAGQLPNGKTHWTWDHGQSVEILDQEIERERKLPQASKPRLKLPGER
jgi:hypothetical protein